MSASHPGPTPTDAAHALTVRRGRADSTHGDESFIDRLATAAFAPYGDYTSLSRWIRAPDVITLVAELPGGPTAIGEGQPAVSGERRRCGFAMVSFYIDHDPAAQRAMGRAAASRTIADLIAIAVDPPWRGIGIGGRLLTQAVAIARSARPVYGVTELRLNVADTNPAAQRLFARHGFVAAATESGLYAAGQHALRMVHPLDR
jgi:ribosomal protein S18 acetylase RimI-like enzyme